MDKMFTNRYREISSIIGFKINIDNRWICAAFTEIEGVNGELITLIDNYCEIYTIRRNKSTKLLDLDKGQINYIYNIIYLLSNNNTLSLLPDIAIDVLQSISHPIAFETLRRIATVASAKIPQKSYVTDI